MDILRKIDSLLESLSNENEIIKSKCSEFLNLSKGLPLFHGRDDELDFENKIKVRSGPRDTKLPVHNKLNDAFKNVFGIAARTECLFTTG